MSQIDRQLTRANSSDTNNTSERPAMMDQEKANVTAAQEVINRQQQMLHSQGPTVEQIQQWQSKGMRVDLPGSPPMSTEEPSQSNSSAMESSTESQIEKTPSMISDAMFDDASRNTEAVAVALERIIQKAKKSIPEDPIAKESKPMPVEPPVSHAAAMAEESIAIAPVPPMAAPNLQPAPIATFQPRWEVPDLSWPETVSQILDRGLEGYEELTKYLKQQAELGKKVISIHSFASGEGCTTLALCLAKLFSNSNIKLALIDANLNHSSMANQLGVHFDQGWEVVAENYGLAPEDIAMISNADNLTLIPLQKKPETADNYAGLRHTISHIKASYDLIIADIGCVDQFPQSLDFIDGAMIVRDMRTNTDEQITEVVRRLTSADAPILGVTENFVD
ncbi:MAG: tyrosine-protein kinase family protein [Pirellulales bacterium]